MRWLTRLRPFRLPFKLDVVEKRQEEHLVKDSGCLLNDEGRVWSRPVRLKALPVRATGNLGGMVIRCVMKVANCVIPFHLTDVASLSMRLLSIQELLKLSSFTETTNLVHFW